MSDTELPNKIQVFIESYLETWNAAEAARVAQYRNPRQMGHQLLKREDVQEAIRQRLDEMAMPANEVLVRMTQQARLNAAMFFDFAWAEEEDADGNKVQRRVMSGINWEMFERFGYLVRKLSYDRKGRPVIEFYDAQRALELLGKHRKVFVDRTDITSGGEPIQSMVDNSERYDRAISTLADAVRKSILGSCSEPDRDMGAAK